MSDPEDVLGDAAAALWPLPEPDERNFAFGGAPQRVWALSSDFQHTAIGLVLWRGALALCSKLFPAACPESAASAPPTGIAPTRGAHVVELGAGPGLCGIAIATAGGASRVLLTDYDEAVLALLRRNRDANAEAAARSGCEDFAVAALDWLAPQPEELRGAFDLAVGSDVTYSRALVRPLVRAATALLRPGGTLVLSNGRARSHEDELELAALENGLVRTSTVTDGAESSNPADRVVVSVFSKPL